VTDTQIKAIIGELWGIAGVALLAFGHQNYAGFCIIVALWQVLKVAYGTDDSQDDNETHA
jgi:hypothetical protein